MKEGSDYGRRIFTTAMQVREQKRNIHGYRKRCSIQALKDMCTWAYGQQVDEQCLLTTKDSTMRSSNVE